MINEINEFVFDYDNRLSEADRLANYLNINIDKSVIKK